MKSVPLVFILGLLSLVLVINQLTAADTSIDNEGGHDEDGDLVRQARNARGRGSNNKGDRGGNGGNVGACRYTKGEWGECDATTNARTRTLTLKRGDQNKCEATKTESRKCKSKKVCRYVKSQWSECDASIHMKERVDQLKPGNDPSCEPTRRVTKKCKGNVGKKQ